MLRKWALNGAWSEGPSFWKSRISAFVRENRSFGAEASMLRIDVAFQTNHFPAGRKWNHLRPAG